MQNGVYLMADTPKTAHPLIVESGAGDKQLLAECLNDYLTDDEKRELVQSIEIESDVDPSDLPDDVGVGREYQP